MVEYPVKRENINPEGKQTGGVTASMHVHVHVPFGSIYPFPEIRNTGKVCANANLFGLPEKILKDMFDEIRLMIY